MYTFSIDGFKFTYKFFHTLIIFAEQYTEQYVKNIPAADTENNASHTQIIYNIGDIDKFITEFVQ